ncbi:MAG: hypothetical protein IPH10_05640 [bacterium]|nr:hypothetical protein [bacterium]
MKKLLIVLALAICAGWTQAAVLKVASNGTQLYTQISTAISAAAANDTILVMSGGYNGFTVDRKLVIIGAGTGAGIGEGVLVNGAVEVMGTADSTELRSLWIRASFANGSTDSLTSVLRIRSGASRIFVWRCFIENYNTTAGYTAAISLGEQASADVVQCVLWSSGSGDSSNKPGILYRSNCNIIVTSSVLANFERGIHSYPVTTGSSCTVSHCIFTTENSNLTPVSGAIAGVAENCVIFSEPGYVNTYTGSMSFSYCAHTNVAPPGATHIAATAAAFVNLNYSDARASDYHLASGSLLINAANPASPFDLDGSRADIGIYGGQHPYVDGGVPDYPFAVQVEVPYTAPLNGTMRIWGRGRVGPGN